MTINIEATIRWKGYNPYDLKPQSGKRVWDNCDVCGKGRWVKYNSCGKLCISCCQKGEHLSEETRKKIGDANIGEKCYFYGKTGEQAPMYGKTGEQAPMYGKHHSEETREKIRVGNIGKKNGMCKIESRKKLSATKQGIPYDEWESFATEQKYCPAFNEACRDSNRTKYDNKCFICGLPESENRTKTGKHKKLAVHHIDMNKNQGCDGNRWRLIPICIYHHSTVHNELWRDRIMYLLNTCWG